LNKYEKTEALCNNCNEFHPATINIENNLVFGKIGLVTLNTLSFAAGEFQDKKKIDRCSFSMLTHDGVVSVCTYNQRNSQIQESRSYHEKEAIF